MATLPLLIDTEVDEWTERLLADGYCVIPELLPTQVVADLDRHLADDFEQTPFCRGDFYGARTKRFGSLLIRSPRAAELVQHPLVTSIVERVLTPWCDTIQLNLTQAIALHPGALPQLPHRDQDMWRGDIGKVEYLVNVTCLETCAATFNRKRSGHTRRPPGRNRSGGLPFSSEVLTPRRRVRRPLSL